AQLGDGQTLWIRFAVPPTQEAERRYLEVPYSSVDRVTLYARDPFGQWVLRQTAGDAIAVSRWPVPHRYPLLPVATSAERPTPYLMRVQNMHGFSAPLKFAAESQVSRADQRVALILGAFFGLAGLACVISLLSAVSLRDSTYGVYALSVLLMALTQAAMTGMAGLHLWPDSPVWNDRAPFALSTIAVAVMMLTLAGVVSTRERSPAVYRVVLALFGISLVASVAMAFSTQPWRGPLTVLCVSVSSVLTAGVMFWAWYRGDRYAPWMLLGTLPVAIGAAFPLTRLLGWTAGNGFTPYMMQFGISIELPVVLVVLMLRTQQQRENVRRIHGAAHTDPSTG
ncbi:MAG: diguanylate cyclase, partial [Rubrivivax sp.]